MEQENITTVKVQDVPGPEEEPAVTFEREHKKVITITKAGIKFHLENFSDYTPDDFAKEFIDLLENSFDVSFTKKNEE